MQSCSPRSPAAAPRTHRSRSGIALLAVLLCLTIVLSLMAAWLRMLVLERQGARQQQASLQAAWLAESALDRAAARLTADPSYTGETWHVPADELGGHDSGEILIQIEAPPDRPQQRTIRVQADYPLALSRRHRASKTMEATIAKSEK